MALSAMGLDVDATDAPDTIGHLENVVEANAAALKDNRPRVAALDWRNPDDARRFVGAVDAVVASDVLICRQWAEALVDVLKIVAPEAPLVIVATQRRRDGVAVFLEKAAAFFRVTELGRDAFHPDFFHEDLQLFRLHFRLETLDASGRL
mmetsp:Transcript_11594/g.35736  ORF Transcript_11594/g.35736 Transcript_11594/m.35736 type:complete len:150 (-) Transcript_11594:16-465(-)